MGRKIAEDLSFSSLVEALNEKFGPGEPLLTSEVEITLSTKLRVEADITEYNGELDDFDDDNIFDEL